MRRGILAGLLTLLALAPSAHADDVLGIPCQAQSDGTRVCGGSAEHRVPAFDGVPLDLDVRLPATGGGFPTVFYLHGFTGTKAELPGPLRDLAGRGYAVVALTARGFGGSCGAPTRDADGCANGYTRFADMRYETRDVQQLAGQLVDAGVSDPARIGVTGTGLGAATALQLAMLRNRVANLDYSLTPWTTSKGTPMSISAVAVRYGWSNFAEALIPNGGDLDYSVQNDYGKQIGVPKASYMGILAVINNAFGHPAPESDFPANYNGWASAFLAGEPFNEYHAGVVTELERHHSPYALVDGTAPAPILAESAWTDDLFPATEMLTLRNRVLDRHPGNEFDLVIGGGGGHPRGSLAVDAPGWAETQVAFLDRLLRGQTAPPVGIRTFTQACAGSKQLGPFDTTTWAGQHPGEIRFATAKLQNVPSTSGDRNEAADDPINAIPTGGCVVTDANDESGAAILNLPRARNGYTILGSPTVRAQVASVSDQARVVAKLWDVAGTRQALVTRAVFRPKRGEGGPQVFQLHPTGWSVAAGHRLKLELVGHDAPYLLSAKEGFNVDVRGLGIRIPVREQPGGQVRTPLPQQDRDANPMRGSALATGVASPCVGAVRLPTGLLKRAKAKTADGRTFTGTKRGVRISRAGKQRSVDVTITGRGRGGRETRTGTAYFCR